MKYSKYTIIVFITSLILFIIPFFWLKPGEMDLGGDSSRLYFYDPFSYIHAQVLYNIVSSGIGGNAVSYYSLPFMILLSGLKFLLSSTLILSMVNGLKISFGFLFCYLIVKELLSTKALGYKDTTIQISAILSGLFYALSPILTNTGWERAILSHMQVFLNPLFFYLLLKFFLNNSKKYLVGILLLTFVFSIGFSYAAAPPFFAFYPISIVFIMLYAKYVREKAISLKRLVFGAILFFLLQAFHILPHLIGIFSLGSDVSASVFSDQTKFSRGLDYFTAIAPSVKVSMGFIALPQIAKLEMLAYANIIFPSIIVLGLYFNKTKAILITTMFFLIVLFFATANITDTGFLFYKSLFYIPGFKMFRNFYGQWAFVFIFFYTILLGQCLAVVLNNARAKYKNTIIAIFLAVVLINSTPLLSGQKINSLHHLSKTSAVFQMDPGYEQVLKFIKNSPIDGKTLALPLTGSGYQVLSGKNGGAYVGPSTFSYLAAKNDYTGYEGLAPFGDFFVQAVKKRDISTIKKLFSILNIKYIFYNSDNKIYDEFFPFFPYDYARLYMPNTQEEYKILLQQLPLEFNKKIDFYGIFHLYPVMNDIFLPHIYTTGEAIYSNKPLELQLDEKINTHPIRSVFLDIKNSEPNRGDIIISADPDSALKIINDNSHLHRHEPFVSVTLDEISYPFVVLKEKFDLWRRRNNHDQYLNFSLLFLSKRIFELDRLGEKMPIGQEDWEEPYVWEFYKWGSYNTWNSSMTRYKQGMEHLIDWVNDNSTGSMLSADKIKINEQLNQHKVRLLKSLNDNPRSNKDYNALITLMNKTFDSLDRKLSLQDYNPSVFNYTIIKPNMPEQEYSVFVQKPERDLYDFTNSFIEVENKKITPVSSSQMNGFIQFQNVRLSGDNSNAVLFLNPINLVKDFSWDSSGNSKVLNDNINLDLNNFVIDGTGGLTKEIPGWRAETQYFITFEYKTFGENLIFKFYDKKINLEKNSKQSGQIYFEKNLNSTVWKKTQSFIHADLDSDRAYLQIIPKTNKKNVRMEIKNLSIFEIDYPKVYFQKINSDTVDKSLPEIMFTKINPTKYKLEVKNAKDPYMLVFQEAFSSNWSIYSINDDGLGIQNSIARIIGNMGKFLVGFFVKENLDNYNVGASHFNGEIREGKHVNLFLVPSTFDSWGKKTIAQEKHMAANGYANAWFIEPKDMQSQNSYTLVLEMSTQRHFYFFLSISLLTALVLFLYFLRFLFGNEKND